MTKKPGKLFALLLDIAQNMRECGSAFSTCDIKSNSELKSFADKIKDFESKGDSMIHETMVELNHAFITPIEHEDILMLAEKMDQVIDEMEECAEYFYMYGLTKLDENMIEFKTQLGLCTDELYIAIDLLVTKDLKGIKEHTIAVKKYEHDCDMIVRKAIRKLFKGCSDPIKLIQYKDMYEKLEKSVDACQAVAKTLDIIVMKNV